MSADCVVFLGTAGWKARAVAMMEAVKAAGYSVIQVSPMDGLTLRRLVDRGVVAFAVTVGMHPPERAARLMLNAAGIDVMVLDLGYFHRAADANDETGYNQAGWNRIGWLPEGPCPGDRWGRLGLKHHAPRSLDLSESLNVLVLGQVEDDSQHLLSGVELENWLWGTVRQLGKAVQSTAAQAGTGAEPNLRVKLRPHPRQSWKPSHPWPVVGGSGVSLELDLIWADFVVTYNSTAGLEAIRRGKFVKASDAALYSGVQGNSPGREEFFRRVAYAQWTIQELSDGTALRFLLGNEQGTPSPVDDGS